MEKSKIPGGALIVGAKCGRLGVSFARYPVKRGRPSRRWERILSMACPASVVGRETWAIEGSAALSLNYKRFDGLLFCWRVKVFPNQGILLMRSVFGDEV